MLEYVYYYKRCELVRKTWYRMYWYPFRSLYGSTIERFSDTYITYVVYEKEVEGTIEMSAVCLYRTLSRFFPVAGHSRYLYRYSNELFNI